MKTSKKITVDSVAVSRLAPDASQKLSQDQETQERGIRNKSRRLEQNASGLNEREGMDELEDLHSEEESRGRLEAI